MYNNASKARKQETTGRNIRKWLKEEIGRMKKEVGRRRNIQNARSVNECQFDRKSRVGIVSSSVLPQTPKPRFFDQIQNIVLVDCFVYVSS